MNAKDWLRQYGREGVTSNYDYNGQFIAVQCGFCEEFMPSPFSGEEVWELWHLIVRRNHRCPHCGMKNRVSRKVTRVTGEEDEE